jgi:hypothetical protein
MASCPSAPGPSLVTWANGWPFTPPHQDSFPFYRIYISVPACCTENTLEYLPVVTKICEYVHEDTACCTGNTVGRQPAVQNIQYNTCLMYDMCTQEAKYVESWPNTTSAWAGWSIFYISLDRYGGVHSLLLCTIITVGSSTCY